MPKHVLMSEVEIITDGGCRRRWSSAEKLQIVEETLDGSESISSHVKNGQAIENVWFWLHLQYPFSQGFPAFGA
ncbi:transposase, partial [Psychromarinibacter sp. C21-152]